MLSLLNMVLVKHGQPTPLLSGRQTKYSVGVVQCHSSPEKKKGKHYSSTCLIQLSSWAMIRSVTKTFQVFDTCGSGRSEGARELAF